MFEEYTRVLNQRYPDIRIEGENYLPQPLYRCVGVCARAHSSLSLGVRMCSLYKCKSVFLSCRHMASFLSMLKFAIIGLIILGKDPFALFGMQSPGIWTWGQENKVKEHLQGNLFTLLYF